MPIYPEPACVAFNPQSRAGVFFNFKEFTEAHMVELALLLSIEQGKMIANVKVDIQRGLEFVEGLICRA